MAGISFRCPNTGLHVYAWIEGEDSEANHIYETMTCTACQRVHLVNSKTGRVVGDDKAPKRPLWPPVGV